MKRDKEADTRTADASALPAAGPRPLGPESAQLRRPPPSKRGSPRQPLTELARPRARPTPSEGGEGGEAVLPGPVCGRAERSPRPGRAGARVEGSCGICAGRAASVLRSRAGQAQGQCAGAG